MPRTVNITLPSEKTEAFVAKIQKVKGLIGLRVQKNISLKPPGDVLSLEITNSAISNLMLLLNKDGLLDDQNTSISTAHPLSVLSKSSSKKITTDQSETTWEETLSTINKQSRMTPNNLVNMLLSSLIAVVGITTNALHIVVGAMILAPGFGAVTRISLGLVTRHPTWKQGLKDTAIGYSTFIGGAILSSYLIQLFGQDVITGSSSYLPVNVLLTYWTSITVLSVLTSVAASVIGAILILSNRSILTAGVMIALSLVPSATISGMALVEGDYMMSARAFGRLIMEIFIIVIFTGLVYILKRRTDHRRNMKI